MLITPGEIARGQWLMVHSPRKEDKEKNWNEQENPLAGLGMLMVAPQQQDHLIPHLVLSVQLPFIAVSDCTTTPCLSRVWRTDEKNFIEVKEDFVKALDTLAWHRGQKLLNPAYQMPMPLMPSYQSNMGLSDLLNQLMAPPPVAPKPKAPRKKKNP